MKGVKANLDIDEVRRLYIEEGLSTVAIARKYGLSKDTVRKYLTKSGVTLRKVGTECAQIKIPNDKIELAYIAGIFDGEGWITRQRNQINGFRVGICNTSAELIKWLKEALKSGIVNERVRTEKCYGKKKVYSWHLYRKLDVLAFLKAITPYLIVKKCDAEKVIQHIRENL